MLTPTGYVIEVEDRILSPKEVLLKEQFYEDCHRGIAWIVKATEEWRQIDTYVPGIDSSELEDQLQAELQHGGETGSVEYRWQSPPLGWIVAKSEVYLDPGQGKNGRLNGALFHLMTGHFEIEEKGSPSLPSVRNGPGGEEEAGIRAATGKDKKQSGETAAKRNGEAHGYGTFVSKREIKKRYRLKLPEQPSDPEQYPAPRPNITIREMDERESEWPPPLPTTL
jgi:hypothetical protein